MRYEHYLLSTFPVLVICPFLTQYDDIDTEPRPFQDITDFVIQDLW